MDADLLPLLACPECHGPLRLDDGRLECAACALSFSIAGDVPDLMPRNGTVDERWRAWAEKQELGVTEYEHVDDAVRSDVDELAREFAAFCDLEGTVLDVGCGIEPVLAYQQASPKAHFVGLDPLDGASPRSFAFVRGIGERLPFGTGAFDGALLATSLDHFPEPQKVLAEVRRILRPQGRVGIWVGVVDVAVARDEAVGALVVPPLGNARWRKAGTRGAGDTARTAWRHLVANRVRSLKVRLMFRVSPGRAVDEIYMDRARYHFHFFQQDEIVDLVERAGLQVLNTRLLDRRGASQSMFVLAEAGNGTSA